MPCSLEPKLRFDDHRSPCRTDSGFLGCGVHFGVPVLFPMASVFLLYGYVQERKYKAGYTGYLRLVRVSLRPMRFVQWRRIFHNPIWRPVFISEQLVLHRACLHVLHHHRFPYL